MGTLDVENGERVALDDEVEPGRELGLGLDDVGEVAHLRPCECKS